MKVERITAECGTLTKDGVVWPLEWSDMVDLAQNILDLDQDERHALEMLPEMTQKQIDAEMGADEWRKGKE
jgi:hypothetical protein